MLKTLSAALIAASLLVAPGLTASADAGQRAQTTTIVTIKPVKMANKHKRHIVKHHDRRKFVKHGRHYKKHGLHLRHGKLVKPHSRVIVTKRVYAR